MSTDNFNKLVLGKAGEGMSFTVDQPDMSNTSAEVNLFDAMAAKVRAGQPIHVSTPLTDPLLRLHMATINRLRAETGLPVHVVYN